ncbi:EamA family transporter [bacterium]|nr:EamA family transporter [bacterium]
MKPVSTKSPDSGYPLAGLFHLGVVYLVWGSTYLAIRIAVMPGDGFKPFMLGGTRTLMAAAILLLWVWLSKRWIKPTRKELLVLTISGLLTWVGGNGLVNWGEQNADSGFAALLVGMLPIWTAIIESIWDRRPPTLKLIGSLLIGFAGLVVLCYPEIQGGGQSKFWAIIALICAPLSWGIGSILLVKSKLRQGSLMISGMQQAAGCVGFFVLVLLFKEPVPDPSPQVWGAWIYLVVAGSLLAFTSYMAALKLLPIPLVMTYGYVNPVIAIFLGWIILGEAITIYTIIGTVLILAGVAGVFHEKRRRYEELPLQGVETIAEK